MRLIRSEHGERGAAVVAVAPRVEAGHGLAGGEQGGEVAGGAAGGEDALGGRAEAEARGGPGEDAALHRGGGGAYLVDGSAVVEERGDEVAEGGPGERRGDLVANEAGMVEVDGVGERARDKVRERLAAGVVEARGPAGEHLVGRDRGEHGQRRAPVGGGEVIGEQVDDRVAVGAEGLGVKGLGEARRR